MDALATSGSCLPQIPRKMLSHTAMGLYDDKDRLVTDLECYLYEKINGSILQEYISKKYEWEQEQMEMIDWYAIGDVVTLYTPFHCKKIVQMMYDWQM